MGKKSLLGICIPLGIICLLMGCNDKIEPGTTESSPPATISTAVAVASISNQPFIYEALGTITAQNSSTLSGKIMGTVKAVNIKEGDAVSNGDTLVILDERQVAAGLRQSEAGLAEAGKAENAAISSRNAAQAGADLAKSTYKRYEKLFKEESATRQEFEEAQARHLQAQAMVSAAQSRVQQAQAAVSGAGISRKDATITAPYDGIVTAKMINVGDLASPGIPLLTLEKIGGFQVEFLVPEHHIQAVQMGQTMEVTIPALENFPPITGTIKTIAPTADAKSRSFNVKMTLPENTTGARVKEVEQQVTKPMEKLLWEIPGVEYTYTTSMPGMSMAVVRFLVGQDEEASIVKLQAKLMSNYDRIPTGVSPPLVRPRYMACSRQVLTRTL